MIKETLEKIRAVTDEYTTINVAFITNSVCRKKDGTTPEKVDITVEWKLYIAEITTKGGNAFPSFNTFEDLDSYVNLLCLELKRVKQTAVKDAVEIAIELFKKEKLIKDK